MSSYYNIFKDTEFIIQNTDSKKTYKNLFKKSYQSGGAGGDGNGNIIDMIYEENENENSNNENENHNENDSDSTFFRSDKKFSYALGFCVNPFRVA